MFLESKQQGLKKMTAIALAVLFLDQVIKFAIVRNIFFEVNIYRNYNALFGLPVNFGLVIVLFIFLVFVFVKYILKFKTRLPKPGFGYPKPGFDSPVLYFAPALILGGILGNLADRIFYGYIIDYLNLFNLFVFNIADLSISFGVLLLSWKVLKK